jgi:hypothetical protein
MKRTLFACAALALLVLAPSAGLAQSTTSSVDGTVADSTGGVIVGASIMVVNTGTGVVYRAASDSLGAFHVTQLPPGTYTMEVSQPSLRSRRRSPSSSLWISTWCRTLF